ncbi:MAG: sugar nucleotide-binding protein [Saccharospirillum sp.]|nr:sugar nucleotide-binding protein [Saccharospirillum sp.]
MSQVVLAGVGDLNRRVACRLLANGQTVAGLRRSEEDPGLGFAQHSLDLSEQLWPDTGAQTVIVALSAPERTSNGYYRGYVAPMLWLKRSLEQWQHLPERIIVVGSSRVYGVDDGRELTEHSPIEPADWAGERLAEMEAAVDALPVQSCVARLSGIYGPGRDWLRRMARAATERPPERNHWTNRIHIEDAAAALVHLMTVEALPTRMVVSDRQPTPLFDVLNYLREQDGLPALVAPEVDGGKRLLSDLLQQSGFKWQFPDYKSGGYSATA